MSNHGDLESALVELVNNGHIKKCKVRLKKHQAVEFYINNQNIFNEIFKVCEFKNAGNIYDYPDVLPKPTYVGGDEISTDFKYFKRIAYSNKFNAVVFYTMSMYSLQCTFIIGVKKLEKFSKKTTEILNRDSGANIFTDTKFDFTPGHYTEITACNNSKTKTVDVLSKKIDKENLVFDTTSSITDVMGDISSFFTDRTFELYKKLEVSYKRGIILYGDPGNGKSAMIREIIRTTPKVAKIVINPSVGVREVTHVLQSLTKALDGKKAIIVIEDIDSLITEYNRSEFLNILDGVDITSGIYFIGTTNYPDQIDPAFMNRSGRFDRTYDIGNPTKATRRLYFESRKLNKLFGDYTLHTGTDHNDAVSVVDLFVENSDNLPMASLKELITNSATLLASSGETTVEGAIKTSYDILTKVRSEHAEGHNNHKQRQMYGGNKFGMMQGMMPQFMPQPIPVPEKVEVAPDLSKDDTGRNIIKKRKKTEEAV
jgi:hypothetical protein